MRVLITIAGNPVLSAPGGDRLARAFDSLDSMLRLDIHVSETTRHADVILPGRSPLEDSHYDVALAQFSFRNHARYGGPVFASEQPPRVAHAGRSWQPLAAQRPGANLNAVLDDCQRDPLSGNAVLSSVPIQLVPA